MSEIEVERDGVPEGSGDVVVVSCGAINSAALLLRSANDKHKQGLANSSGPGRAQLHVPPELGHPGDLHQAEPHRVPEDPRDQRLLPQRAATGSTRWATSDARQGDQGDAAGGAAPFVPRAHARLHGEPLDRLVDHLGGPAVSRQPRDARAATAASLEIHAEQRGRAQSAARQAEGIERRSGPRSTLFAERRLPRSASRSPASPTRSAPRFGPTPRRSVLDVNCKAHESTTSTWSTAASSARAGP